MTRPSAPVPKDRDARLREALRANLQRRKAQARARKDDETQDTAAPPVPKDE